MAYMIRAIVFDCFGVLAEDGWLPFKRKYIGENLELSQAITDLGKQNDYGMIGNNDYFSEASKLIGVPEQTLRDAVDKKVPNEELFEFIQNELKPNYKIGLLSNANYDVVQDLFTNEQASLFDATVMSYESRLVKPDPRMFQLMADRLGVRWDECLFIDDVERYCIAAEELGISSIVYSSPGQLKQEILQRLEKP
jgi:putative hydrolase of the HAD superfamily